jgi:hypothetical protein
VLAPLGGRFGLLEPSSSRTPRSTEPKVRGSNPLGRSVAGFSPDLSVGGAPRVKCSTRALQGLSRPRLSFRRLVWRCLRWLAEAAVVRYEPTTRGRLTAARCRVERRYSARVIGDEPAGRAYATLAISPGPRVWQPRRHGSIHRCGSRDQPPRVLRVPRCTTGWLPRCGRIAIHGRWRRRRDRCTTTGSRRASRCEGVSPR